MLMLEAGDPGPSPAPSLRKDSGMASAAGPPSTAAVPMMEFEPPTSFVLVQPEASAAASAVAAAGAVLRGQGFQVEALLPADTRSPQWLARMQDAAPHTILVCDLSDTALVNRLAPTRCR